MAGKNGPPNANDFPATTISRFLIRIRIFPHERFGRGPVSLFCDRHPGTNARRRECFGARLSLTSPEKCPGKWYEANGPGRFLANSTGRIFVGSGLECLPTVAEALAKSKAGSVRAKSFPPGSWINARTSISGGSGAEDDNPGPWEVPSSRGARRTRNAGRPRRPPRNFLAYEELLIAEVPSD